MGAILVVRHHGLPAPAGERPAQHRLPTIQVAAALAGREPRDDGVRWRRPLEKNFTTIAGIDSMTSSSALGLTQITIQFSLDRNIDAPPRTCRR